MSTEGEEWNVNQNDGNETERMIKEARRMLDNTRAFLEHIRDGEEGTRRYIDELRTALENDVRRLELKRQIKDESHGDTGFEN